MTHVNAMDTAISKQSQVRDMFPPGENQGRPAPPLGRGFHFSVDGVKVVAEAATGVSEADLDAFRLGDAELRTLGHGMLAFGLAVRFRLGGHVTGWLRVVYSWPDDSDCRKATPVDAPNPRLLPPESRRLLVVVFAPGGGDAIAIRHMIMDQTFAWALDRRVQDTRQANNKPRWLAELTRQLADAVIPERSDPRVEIVGTAVDAPPAP